MAFPAGSYGLVPWMNGRVDAGIGNELSDATCVSFPYGGNVVFKWIEDGTYPNIEIAIWAHGRWGTDRQYNDHYAIAKARTTPPAAPTYTVANRTALFAIVSPAQDQTALVTSDNSYWIFYGLSWIRLVQKVNAGTITVYAVTATIYTITVPQTDIPEIDGMLIEPGGYYDLCWEKNSGHAKRYDATFNVLPVGYKIYDEIPDRTELNSRVAGEKALFEDEFVTASQIEAGSGITIKYRTIAGAASGYSTDAAKGGNIILESAGGAAKYQAAYYPFSAGNTYYNQTSDILRFQNEPQDYPDSMVTIPKTTLPVYFDVVYDPAGGPPNDVSIVRARAANNNLHVSVTQLNTVNLYPMQVAGGYTDYTVNHLRFKDVPNLTWNIVGTNMPTLMPDGTTSVRQGIVITPQLHNLYDSWSVKSGLPQYYQNLTQQTQYDNESYNIGYTVDSLDSVEFFGKNGVVCTLEGILDDKMRVMVDRKLFIKYDRNKPIAGLAGNTTTVQFNADFGQESTFIYGDTQYSNSIDKSIAYSDASNRPSDTLSGGSAYIFRTVPTLPIPFTVNGDPNDPGGRIVQGWETRNSARWSSQWIKDYDAVGNNDYRTLSDTQTTLAIGFYGWGDTNGNPTAGADLERLIFEKQNVSYNTNSGVVSWDPAAVGIGTPPVINPDEYPLGLRVDQEGLYLIEFTVQGLMGLKVAPPFNPVISQALHLHLINGVYSPGMPGTYPESRVMKSLDIQTEYNFIPQGASQTGYAQAVNSRPFSLQGCALVWLKPNFDNVYAWLSYNPGVGEHRFFYQICYVGASCIKVAHIGDIYHGFQAVDIKEQAITEHYQPQRWHNMNFF